MCSGLLTSSAKGASAARASTARGAWTSSRTLESLWTMSAFSGLAANRLLPGRLRIRGPFSCWANVAGGQEVACVPQGAPERRLRRGCHNQMLFSGPHAVLAGPRVIGDERGERRIGALDEAGKPPVVDLGGSLGDVIEQARSRIGKH